VQNQDGQRDRRKLSPQPFVSTYHLGQCLGRLCFVSDERIVVHLLVELYARTEEEAIDVLEDASRGTLEITSLAEESRPPAHAADEAH